MKVQFHIAVVGAILLSNIASGAPSSASTSLDAAPGANQLHSVSRLEKIRRHLGANSRNVLHLPEARLWENSLGSGSFGSYTMEDSLATLSANAPTSRSLENSAAPLKFADNSSVASRVPMDISYPTTFSGAVEAAADLAASENPSLSVSATPISGYSSEHSGIHVADASPAWAAQSSGGEPAYGGDGIYGSSLRDNARPNVIIPEPGVFVLFAVFAAALFLFSDRRAVPKSGV